MGLFSFFKRQTPNLQQLGNVTADKVKISSATGKRYPPDLKLTQPGEYGIRIRGGEKFQNARAQVFGRTKGVWSGAIDVEQEGDMLKIQFAGKVLGEISPKELEEHPEISKGAAEGAAFRGAIVKESSFDLKLFMKL